MWRALAGNCLPTNFFGETDMHKWMQWNLKQGSEWGSIFSNMLWYSWKIRNMLVFEGKETVEALSSVVTMQVEVYKSTVEQNQAAVLLSTSNDVQWTEIWSVPPIG